MLKPLNISTAAIIERLKISGQFSSAVLSAIRHQIIQDAAGNEGIVVTEVELQQAADDFRVAHNLYDPNDTWRWLQDNCLTGEEFEQSIYESILTPKLVQHLFGDRVEAYFYENQLDFTRAVLYEVVFANFDTAIELYYALKEKETTFIEVARKYIAEPDLRRKHGYKGIVSRQELNSAISSGVFAASPPQILKPITINQNTHLILVEEIIEPQLTDAIYSQITERLFSDWLEKQLKLYAVEISA